MVSNNVQDELEDAQRTIRSLQQELAETNRGLLALVIEFETRLDERTAELRLAHAELERTNSEILQTTLELQAANKELEAFSHSVSHDLRAPLRAVDAYSKLLMERYAGQLPEEARHLLTNVRTGADRMGHLIDGLLRFSMLGTKQLLRRPLKTEGLVREVVEELVASSPERRTHIHVGDLPDCVGDPLLLKQVFVNLVSNAMKFTRQRADGNVQIGCSQQNGENVYFVRDNGVGFDMQYAGKLFAIFKRLHTQTEFEGNGVGLSIVQRIVHRHGGRIWVEAEPNKGATFYFTLSDKHPEGVGG